MGLVRRRSRIEALFPAVVGGKPHAEHREIVRILKREGIRTVGVLSERSREDIADIRQLGDKRVSYIVTQLKQAGFSLK